MQAACVSQAGGTKMVAENSSSQKAESRIDPCDGGPPAAWLLETRGQSLPSPGWYTRHHHCCHWLQLGVVVWPGGPSDRYGPSARAQSGQAFGSDSSEAGEGKQVLKLGCIIQVDIYKSPLWRWGRCVHSQFLFGIASGDPVSLFKHV